jgi:hypothetical protein
VLARLSRVVAGFGAGNTDLAIANSGALAHAGERLVGWQRNLPSAVPDQHRLLRDRLSLRSA